MKPILTLCWGAHGSGKTRFLECLEKRHYGKFLPIFSDLYCNKDDVPHKLITVEEMLRFPYPIIMEGKRGVDTGLMKAFETHLKEEHYKHHEFHIILAISSEEASVRRVNERRLARGQTTDWKYEDNRGPYESHRRFLNKIKQLYEENPLIWSMFHTHVIEVENDAPGAWAPIEKLMDDHISQFNDDMVIDPIKFPDLTRIWNFRQNTLKTKGQEYFDLRLGSDVIVQPLLPKSIPVVEKVETEEPELPLNDEPVSVERKPEPKTSVPRTNTPKMILSLTPCPHATSSQLSKVKRGFKKAGFESVDDELVRRTVGAILAQGVDPVDKGSSWVAVRIKENLNGLLMESGSGTTPPEPIYDDSVPLEPEKKPLIITDIGIPQSPVKQVESAVAPVLVMEGNHVKVDGPPWEETASQPSRLQELKERLRSMPAADKEKIVCADIGFMPLLVTPPLPEPKATVGPALDLNALRFKVLGKTLTAEEEKNPTVLNGLTLHVEPENVDGEVQVLEDLDDQLVVREQPERATSQPPLADIPPAVDEPVEEREKPKAIGWVFETTPKMHQGFLEHATCKDAYVYAMQDLLNNGQLSKRVGMVTRSFRPYTMVIADASDSLVTLPGTQYYEPTRSYIRDNLDWLQGEILTGGLSYRFDKRCQKVYPKASGQIDWTIKGELGKYGRDQISWLRRNLRMDHASRNAIACMWDPDRDLIGFTARNEKGWQGGDSYQRIPCPLTMTVTRDDSSRVGDKKALQMFVNWRVQDFTSSTQADIMMCGEVMQYLALTTENRSYPGRLKFDIGTFMFGSHGAAQFVYFNNLVEWWKRDERCYNIDRYYPKNFQCRSNTVGNENADSQFGQPRQKAYDWFLARWDDFLKTEYHWRKGQWWHINESWNNIGYSRWKDLSLSLAIFEMGLIDSLRAEVLRLYGHNAQIKRMLNFEKELGDYVPFYFLDKIEGIHHYWAAMELASYLIAKRDYDKLQQLLERPSIRKCRLWDIILSDALISQSGSKAVNDFVKQCPDLYAKISSHCDVIMER